MTAALQPRRTRSRWAAGCLVVLLSSFLLLGVVYWGYCWGWWGRTNLTLQYLFQCQCPAASEAVRYRPYTVLAAACRNPEMVDLSPSGQFLIVAHQRPTPHLFREDLSTGQVQPLPLDPQESIRLYHIQEHLLFIRLKYRAGYRLLDLHDDTQITLPWRFADQLDTTDWELLQNATQVTVLPLETVALTPGYKQHPEHNLVISTSSTQRQIQIQQQLDAAGIAYQSIPPPYTTGPVADAQYSHDGRFWADTEGIALAQTDERIVTLDLPPLEQPYNFRPFGWTPDNRAVVYAAVFAGGWVPHLIEMEYLPWRWFPVPQPILLVEVPEEYWDADSTE